MILGIIEVKFKKTSYWKNHFREKFKISGKCSQLCIYQKIGHKLKKFRFQNPDPNSIFGRFSIGQNLSFKNGKINIFKKSTNFQLNCTNSLCTFRSSFTTSIHEMCNVLGEKTTAQVCAILREF